MSGLISSGVVLCEPTQLYNILTRCNSKPSVTDPNYLLLLDVRSREDYEHNHCILSCHIKQELGSEELFEIPSGFELTTIINCIVYDNNTVSVIENTPAVKLANQLASSGSRNPVMILKGGYERLSGEYSFLRTQKMHYTPLELEYLPHYPSEILPLFLYLGDKRHAYNASLNHDLTLRSHINVLPDSEPAFPGMINELNVGIEDVSSADLLSKFDETCEFIESCRKKSERILVFGIKGISRSAAIVAAYLIKYKKMSCQESLCYIKKCRPHVLPLHSFIQQLKQWETQCNNNNTSAL